MKNRKKDSPAENLHKSPRQAKCPPTEPREKPEEALPGILRKNPQLMPFRSDIEWRIRHYQERCNQLLAPGQRLSDFASGARYFGFHQEGDHWVYREWAPGAKAMHLIGEFNGWDRESHPMTALPGGNWEIRVPGQMPHETQVKVEVTCDWGKQDRIPLYATCVRQSKEDNGFHAVLWNPPVPFAWTDEAFRPAANVPPVIYEAHVGMATEAERVGTYLEFMRDILPRIQRDGYNTVQLMAIMEHPYYASFGYQVSNFFAASSWYGTPDDLKALVNEAHRLGLSVLLDCIHSHAVRNTAEGIDSFDGRGDQFFKEGSGGDHPAWGSKVFDYGKNGVVHFLLSNLRFWMEEYHFDGFRFDGVTSMLYLDHGLGTAFMRDDLYFSMNTDIEAVAYLQLATALIHEFKPGALCIAEEMSAMPGMCLPIEEGGFGFDYRLSMGLPDFFIRTIREREDGHWDMSRLYWEMIVRRPDEKVIAYAESHDQALVGDKTIMFRLADKEMYEGMNRAYENGAVERAMALHKMIRLVTIGCGGEGYLNFMGNEFGHPEWIDFPREGNGWSFAHARRLWSLAENGYLRYSYLGDFDKAMIEMIRRYGVLSAEPPRCLRQHESDQILAFEKGGCIFCFNFHPCNSQKDLFVPAPWLGDYRIVLSSDDPAFGGYGNVDSQAIYHTWAHDPDMGDGFRLYLPARTAVVLRRVEPKKKAR